MKLIKLLTLALVVTGFGACKKELFDIKFGLNTKDATFTIKPHAAAGTFTVDSTFQNVNLDSIAKANGADVSKVKSAKIKKITLTILSPSTANFDIVESGKILLGSNTLPLITVASFNNIPDGATTFDITPDDVDILPYAKGSTIFTSAEVTTNGPVTEPIKVKLTVTFEIVANPL